MVKVDEYARIRHAHRCDKMSIRQLARRFHHSRRNIREILAQPEPKTYQRQAMPSVVDRFKPVIDAILRNDDDAPRKQRHTVAKIYRRLRDEHGYAGSYARVRHYVLSLGRTRPETFSPKKDLFLGERWQVPRVSLSTPTSKEISERRTARKATPPGIQSIVNLSPSLVGSIDKHA
jgi:hypothetical protein